jgi:Flp pilus assembly protein TadD
VACRRLRRYPEAEEALRRAAQVAPDDAVVRYNLAVTLRAPGRKEEAVVEYREAVRLDPDLKEAWGDLGLLLREAGDDEGAIQALRRWLELAGPDDPEAEDVRGILQELEE